MTRACNKKPPNSPASFIPTNRTRVSLDALPGVVISGATTQGGRRRLLKAANPKHAALLKADMPYVVRALPAFVFDSGAMHALIMDSFCMPAFVDILC
jgi:hypothetical protein